MSYGLESTDLHKIQQVLSGFPQIDRAILYGSRAKGNYRPGSDIDLCLEGSGLDLSIMNLLSLQLDDLLLPYLFDLSVHSHIQSKELIDHIHRVGIPIYSTSVSHS